jgi:choline dehydrogenase
MLGTESKRHDLIERTEIVLVVEYGDVQYAPGQFDPPDLVFGTNTGLRPPTFSYQSLPNPQVKNKTATVITGKTVGGSSAVNGMVFDRPSRFDHDAWAHASSPEFDASEHKWNWDGIFPYFKKVRYAPTLHKRS